MAGVSLVIYNEARRQPAVISGEEGEYAFFIPEATATWYIAIIDESDQPLSRPAQMKINTRLAGRYILDWQRLH